MDNPELKRLGVQALKAGGAADVGNPILEAHYEVSRKIREKTPDPMSRDLGIIAASQLALHYWIASFGTLANYAAKAGLSETEQNMKTSLAEAKQADQEQTGLAEKMLGQGAQA